MTLLFGLAGVMVEWVALLVDAATRRVHVCMAVPAAACPACGVFSAWLKENMTTNLPYGQASLQVRWHKWRWRCRELRCERQTFTEATGQLLPGAWLTGRLRRGLACAIEDNCCVDEVARSLGVGWSTAQRRFDARAAQMAGKPAETPMLGIDGNAPAGSVAPTVGGAPRPVGDRLVDLAGGQGLPGQVPGQTSRCVVDWLKDRSKQWRADVQFVALDPSAPYAAAVCQALPSATIVVDLPPGAAGQPDGHEGVATHHTGDVGPPGPGRRPGVGEPAAAATEPTTAVRPGVHPDVGRRPRSFQRTASRLDRHVRSCADC